MLLNNYRLNIDFYENVIGNLPTAYLDSSGQIQGFITFESINNNSRRDLDTFNIPNNFQYFYVR